MAYSNASCDGGQLFLFSYSNLLRNVLLPEAEASIKEFTKIFALILDMMTKEESEYLYSVNQRGRKQYLPLSLYGITLYMHYSRHETMRDTLASVSLSPSLRKILFLNDDVPSEATMSRRVYELMDHIDQERLALLMHDGKIIRNAAIDSTICQAREKAVKSKKQEESSEKKESKGKRGRPKKGSEEERIIRERQEAEAKAYEEKKKNNLELPVDELLSSLDLEMNCSWTAKSSSLGRRQWFRGYKIHMLCDERGMVASYLITGASVHDSKVAIYLMRKYPYFRYALMDKAYVSKEIEDFCSDAGHIAIIDKRSNQENQLTEQEEEIYKGRTVIERVNSSIKECFFPPRIRFKADRLKFAMETAILLHNVKTKLKLEEQKIEAN